MGRLHYQREVLGLFPAAVDIEFKEKVNLEDIEAIQEMVDEIVYKCANDLDDSKTILDSFDENGIGLNLTLNLRGICDYISASRDEPEGEDITWEKNFSKILDVIKQELSKVKNFETVSIFSHENLMEIYPLD